MNLSICYSDIKFLIGFQILCEAWTELKLIIKSERQIPL
jgi:hypothetical protein